MSEREEHTKDAIPNRQKLKENENDKKITYVQVSGKHFLNGFDWATSPCDTPSTKEGCPIDSLDIGDYGNCPLKYIR